MKLLPAFLPLLLCASASLRETSSAAPQPNLLVILTDDLGFSDLGCYGSEIDTPTLDHLASNGLRFTQFYNTAKCHSSRVSLLSGRWCRQAGDIRLDRAVTIPEILQPAGYFTAMSGKWHLTKQPTDFGFQRYFGHLSGACNYYRGDNTFRLNGEPWKVPDKGFYTTVAKVDFALQFIEEARRKKKPWFTYLAFNAPHAPLQPLKEDYEKYLGRYDEGWDKMRTKRLAKQRKLDLFGKDVEPSPRPPHIPAWDDLIPEIRDWEARRMAALAGMIDRIDRELGRLVKNLEAAGDLDNTLILFFSDNGACPYDRRHIGMDRQPYDPDVTWGDSTGWSWARNSPFRYYKQNQYEGGVCTAAVVHWPAGIKRKPGSTVHTPAHLVDILPTLAELAGAEIPETYPGREPTPLAGTSLVPIFAGKEPTNRPPIHLLFSTDRGLRDGDWKLASFRSQPWELFNIAEDRTELNDLAAKHPEIVERMSKEWHRMTREVLMAPEKECKPVAETATGHVHPEWSDYGGEHGAITNSRYKPGAPQKPKKKQARRHPRPPRNIPQNRKRRAHPHLPDRRPRPRLRFPRQARTTRPLQAQLPGQERSRRRRRALLHHRRENETPNGEQLIFEVTHDGKWHDVTLDIPTSRILHALRLDPCSTEGTVRIKRLTLQTSTGKPLRSWP